MDFIDILAEVRNSMKTRNPFEHSKDSLAFILAQAEKQLTASLEAITFVYNKSIMLFSAVSVILTSSVSYFLIKLDSGVFFDRLAFSSFSISVYLFCIIYLLFKNIVTIKYMDKGSDPSEIMTKCKKVEQERYDKFLIFGELINYEARSKYNFLKKEVMLSRTTKAINMITLMPLVFLILYIFISILFGICF